MDFLNKKNVLELTILLGIILWLVAQTLPIPWCKDNVVCSEIYYSDYLGVFVYSIIGFMIAVLPFSLLTLFLKEKVFDAWKKFAVWGVPLVLILTYLVTRDTGGSNFFSMDLSLYFLAIIYGLFFLGSLAVIIFTAFKKN